MSTISFGLRVSCPVISFIRGSVRSSRVLVRAVSFSSAPMDLRHVVSALERFAPLSLSESWDNVGLLLAPSPPHMVSRVLLTNDLTPSVLDEAERGDVQLVVSYHPPIFSALKRLDGKDWKGALLVRCLERRIALYSPHTCWDAVAGGVNDWLASAFETKLVCPISRSPGSLPADCSHWVLMDIPLTIVQEGTNENTINRIKELVADNPGVTSYRCTTDENSVRVEYYCQESVLLNVTEILTTSGLGRYFRISRLEKLGPLSDTGMGRSCRLAQTLTLSRVVEIIKGHLNLTHVRLALGRGRSMEEPDVATVALCAGSGASVLRHALSADVYWTGEMSHHDVLDAVQRGVSVILCEHSNTERGFLRHFGPKLKELTAGKTEVLIAKTDVDPLVVV